MKYSDIYVFQSPKGMSISEKTQWFAMRATYSRELEVKNKLDEKGIGSFIPMHYEIRMVGRHKKHQLVPVIHNLIFVHSTCSELQEVKSGISYLQYITDSRSGQKIIVPDEQMKDFIAVAGTYDEHLLFFKPEEINLAKGTPVRIIGGKFVGHEGIFIKVKGARDRRVVICIQGLIAMAMATISPYLIEIIKEPQK